MVKKIISAGVGLLLLAAPLAVSAQSASLPVLPANPTIAQLQAEIQSLIQFLDQLIAARGGASTASANTSTPAATALVATAISATTSLAATSSSTTPVVPLTTSTAAVAAFSWSQSLPVTFAASGIGPFRGTEARALVFSGGSLYAGIGDWEDPDFEDAKEPGAQILRLDSANGTWVVDQDFNEPLPSSPTQKLYLAIGALSAVQFTKDDTGQTIAPVDTMFASVWSNGAGLDIFQKIGDSGAWTRVRLVDAATATAGLGSQVRAFVQYTDSVTGKQLVLAGTNPFGIFDGLYDSGSGTVIWSATAESGSVGVPLVNSEGKKGATSDRVMSFAVCGGKLYASIYDGIVVRTDGPSPSWSLIYEQPSGTLPDSSSGFRGLTCVPNTHGSGDMLIAALENNPLEIYDIQITPPYTGVIEKNLSSYASSQLGATVGYGIGAYNDMLAYPSATASCPDELIGLHFAAPNYPGAYEGVYPSALYVARHCDGTYGPVETIADPTISPAPPLEATRTMVVSQFPGDPAGTLYAGGYDAHSTPAYNTDWIYRGASSGACAVGSILQGGFCIIPPPVILAPTLNVSTTTTSMPATVTFSGSAPGPTYTLKYGDKTKVSTQACTGSAAACAAVTISQTHTYAAAGTYVATVTTAAGSASTTITVVTPPPAATLTQSLATTNFNGNKAQVFTISWSSTNATSCTLQKANANGTVTDPWATGTSGSQTAVPTVVGTLHWWIDCTGPGGTVHEDLYHAVVQGKLTTTATASDQLSNMASVLVAIQSILNSLAGSGH